MQLTNRLCLSLIPLFLLISYFCPVSLAVGLLPEQIIEMHENGKTSEQIISTIRSRGLNFEVNLPIMEKLIKEGLSKDVLEELIQSGTSIEEPRRMSFSGEAKAGIAVLTDPPGFNVQLNGKDLGVTPSLSNKLPAGKYHIKVSHPLFFTKEETISYDGKKGVVLNWLMEPKEPLVRVDINIQKSGSTQPWSWILRPRKQCPGCDVDLTLKAWKSTTETGEAVFLLSDNAKKLFHGEGVTCLELNLWKGKVRRDLSIRRLPPPTVRYFISDVKINGIKSTEISVDVKINEINPTNPEVSISGDSGFLIKSDLSSEAQKEGDKYEEMIETLDGVVQ